MTDNTKDGSPIPLWLKALAALVVIALVLGGVVLLVHADGRPAPSAVESTHAPLALAPERREP